MKKNGDIARVLFLEGSFNETGSLMSNVDSTRWKEPKKIYCNTE